MRVIPQPQAFHFLVPSEDVGQERMYDVDLLACEGNDGVPQGRCTCADWMNRIGPFLERNEDPPRRFCKHIIACREVMMDTVARISLANLKADGSQASAARNNG